MRVRFRRTQSQQRARGLLAFALLLPAAGTIQAAGANPASIGAAAIFLFASIMTAASAIRPVLVALRSGVTINGQIGRPSVSLTWREIESVELVTGAVSLTTTGQAVYQLHVDARAGQFLSHMVERELFSGRR